ncbi:hypothetical protein RclHR1_02520005 [Rhizophagus clarus]|uniref:Uncharacterized protein n=1 Tax=Rhizophagus clarus TaxID=94130 RepID=A0A2Z6QZA9_9GLOM|nr:hypothetical protein RclHR1_02520005 [Rhizophagus clarus]
MPSWKYSFERLSKHKYVACVIHPKKVVCICGKKIKLNRKWEEDYLNRHVRRSECKADEGQRTLYNWFKPIEIIEEEEEYESDVYDDMDDDDLIRIDEIDDDDQNQEFLDINVDEINNTGNPKKRKLICVGLQSEEISKYIKRTPAQFGGSRRVEIVARELFPHLFSQKFILVILGGFSSRALDLFRQNLEGRTIQSIRQLRRSSEDCLTNPDLCYENVARFKD